MPSMSYFLPRSSLTLPNLLSSSKFLIRPQLLTRF
jgi:hypothetical protein